jgi:hypothetical protein
MIWNPLGLMVKMNQQQIIKEFIKVEKGNTSTKLFVKEIKWESPHTPTEDWILISEVGFYADKAKVDEMIKAILMNEKYFKTCEECDEINPDGWMHDNKICQGCATKHHGVVY